MPPSSLDATERSLSGKAPQSSDCGAFFLALPYAEVPFV